jgi:hypothetical protein
MLSAHMADELIELTMAHVFVHPAPANTVAPQSAPTAFGRWLALIGQHDWLRALLVVEFNANTDGDVADTEAAPVDEQRQSMHKQFVFARPTLPPMCVVYSTGRGAWTSADVFTRRAPTAPVLARIIRLAQVCFNVIRDICFLVYSWARHTCATCV